MGCTLFDLTNKAVLSEVIKLLRSGQVYAAHFGTPCVSWSTARRPAHGSLDATTTALGFETSRITLQLLRICRAEGIHISVENPKGSGLWRWKPFEVELQQHPGLVYIHTDYCAWGMPFRKVTIFATSIPGMQDDLSKTCCCHGRHIPLSGTVKLLHADGFSSSRWLTQSLHPSKQIAVQLFFPNPAWIACESHQQIAG